MTAVRRSRPRRYRRRLDGRRHAYGRTDSTRLVLHAGYSGPGRRSAGSPDPAISEAEKPKLLAAFNGGFRLGLGLGGFLLLGRNVRRDPARPGVRRQYADGTVGLGAWGTDVPAPGKKLVSIRQNLGLLVDAGQPAADID